MLATEMFFQLFQKARTSALALSGTPILAGAMII